MYHQNMLVHNTHAFFFRLAEENQDETRRMLRRTGKELAKRNLTLVDDTCTEISMTIWGEKAKESGEQWEGNPVVAWKGVKVSPFSFWFYHVQPALDIRAAGPFPFATVALVRGDTEENAEGCLPRTQPRILNARIVLGSVCGRFCYVGYTSIAVSRAPGC